MRFQRAGIEAFTLHDLRRSASRGFAEQDAFEATVLATLDRRKPPTVGPVYGQNAMTFRSSIFRMWNMTAARQSY